MPIDRDYNSRRSSEERQMLIPANLDREFLEWFKARTESSWASRPHPHAEGWRKDTRWAKPLSEADISRVEKKWQLEFPPDYRLFLSVLHTVDRHPLARRWLTGDRSELIDSVSFPDWLSDDAVIKDRLAWPLQGLMFDLKNNDLWLAAWGPKPPELKDRQLKLAHEHSKSPRLVPVFGHRYLLAQPCQAGNPVLSIYQADIIIYGATLRDYFLNEFHYEAGLSPDDLAKEKSSNPHLKIPLAEIPFWGPISVEGNQPN